MDVAVGSTASSAQAVVCPGFVPTDFLVRKLRGFHKGSLITFCDQCNQELSVVTKSNGGVAVTFRSWRRPSTHAPVITLRGSSVPLKCP